MGVSLGLRTQQLSDTMFSRFQPIARSFSTSSVDNVAVAVMGAAGGIGQPLSMLLKLNPAVSKLALYDIVHTVGVAADLSHIDQGPCGWICGCRPAGGFFGGSRDSGDS